MRTPCDRYAVDENHELVINGAVEENGLDLFNLRAFHDLHTSEALRSFHFALCDRRTGTLGASVHVHESASGEMASPFRGSFGGFALAPARH
jgi:hypothetical protein